MTFAGAIFNESEQGLKARGRHCLPSYFMVMPSNLYMFDMHILIQNCSVCLCLFILI